MECQASLHKLKLMIRFVLFAASVDDLSPLEARVQHTLIWCSWLRSLAKHVKINNLHSMPLKLSQSIELSLYPGRDFGEIRRVKWKHEIWLMKVSSHFNGALTRAIAMDQIIRARNEIEASSKVNCSTDALRSFFFGLRASTSIMRAPRVSVIARQVRLAQKSLRASFVSPRKINCE